MGNVRNSIERFLRGETYLHFVFDSGDSDENLSENIWDLPSNDNFTHTLSSPGGWERVV